MVGFRERPCRERCRVLWLALRAAFGLSVCVSSALAAPQPPLPFLLGGPLVVETPKLRVDPSLPTGAPIYRSWHPRPAAEHRACSLLRPVCVLGSGSGFHLRAPEMLSELERAYERMVLGLRLPPPVLASSLSNAESLDVYLQPDASDLNVVIDERPLSVFDEARVFCEAPYKMEPSEVAGRCLGQAIAMRLDASATAGVREALGAYLTFVTLGPTNSLVESLDNFQARPDLGLFSEESAGIAAGSFLMFDYLEAHSPRGPGFAAASLVSASASQTPAGAWSFFNEPDLFDVVRRTFDDDAGRFASFSAMFALNRAFLGPRYRAGQTLAAEFAGDFARVHFDWTLEASSLPRRVASLRPLAPNGSIYVWLNLDTWSDKDVLGFEATWEEPVPFKWTLSKITKTGEIATTVDIMLRQKARTVQQRVVGLEGLAGVLIVGTNLGGIRSDQPFDPDLGPFEPHGCTVYLAKVPD